MSLIFSVLALFVGLVAVYLAADSKHSIETKIRNYADVYSNAFRKNLEDCVHSIDIMSERLETLESDTGNLPEIKKEIIGELATINNKITDIRQEMITRDTALFKKKEAKNPEPVVKS